MRDLWDKMGKEGLAVKREAPEGKAPREEWMLVTPGMAETWLESNDGNRRLVSARVLRFAEDMDSGRWAQYHPHGISFDANGRLIDGQHRLHAIVLSGASVWMRVTTGLPSEMQSFFDLGAPRTTGEVLRREGIKDPNNISTIAAMLYWYDNFPDQSWNSAPYPSKTFILDYVRSNHETLTEAITNGNAAYRAISIPLAQYGALYVLADRAGLLDYWGEWHSGIVSGAGLRKGDPRLTLRNYFGHAARKRERKHQWHRQRHLAFMIKGFRAFHEGDDVHALRFEVTHLPMPLIIDEPSFAIL